MNNYEVRYVFDIGSSNTKSMACLVDTNSMRLLAIIDRISVPVPYQKYINNSHDGRTLSAEAMAHGSAALGEILKYYGIDSKEAYIKCAGIATAWARNADNAEEYLKYLDKEMGIHIASISQHEEGKLGIQAVLASPGCPAPDADKMLIWDIGGGSFQLSYIKQDGEIQVYDGSLGSVNFAKTIREMAGCDTNKLLNMTQLMDAIDIARDLIGKPLSECIDIWDIQTRASSCVYGIGQLMNVGIKPMIYNDTICKKEVFDLLEIFTKHSIEELKEMYPEIKAEFIVPQQTNLLLIHTIMDALDMSEIHFLEHVQSLNAIAVYENLWEDENFNDLWYADVGMSLDWVY